MGKNFLIIFFSSLVFCGCIGRVVINEGAKGANAGTSIKSPKKVYPVADIGKEWGIVENLKVVFIVESLILVINMSLAGCTLI